MNRSGFITRRPAAGVLAAAAASGLVLAGCGNSSAAPAASSGSASGQAAGSASAASPGPASGGSVTTTSYFPVTVGDTWVYQEKLSTSSGTVSNQVTAVTPAAGGSKVTMKVKDDLLGLHKTTSSVLILHPDGSISVPLTQLGSTAVTIKSGSIIWPSSAQLASGQPQHDTLVMSINEAGHASTITAQVVVKGAGTQTVSVPAGTYQATVIDETMNEKFAGFAVGMHIRTWVADGVGPVKSEVVSQSGGRSVVRTSSS